MRFSPGCECCAPPGDNPCTDPSDPDCEPCVYCPQGLPTTLFVTFLDVSGAACLDGLSFPITWNGTNWVGAAQITCGCTACETAPFKCCISVILQCVENDPPPHQMLINVNFTTTLAAAPCPGSTICGSIAEFVDFDCDNASVSFTGTIIDSGLCVAGSIDCLAGDQVEVVITP